MGKAPDAPAHCDLVVRWWTRSTTSCYTIRMMTRSVLGLTLLLCATHATASEPGASKDVPSPSTQVVPSSVQVPTGPDQLGGVTVGKPYVPKAQDFEANGKRIRFVEVAGEKGELFINLCGGVVRRLSFQVDFTNSAPESVPEEWRKVVTPSDSADTMAMAFARSLVAAGWSPLSPSGSQWELQTDGSTAAVFVRGTLSRNVMAKCFVSADGGTQCSASINTLNFEPCTSGL